jgi:hypothetical protein
MNFIIILPSAYTGGGQNGNTKKLVKVEKGKAIPVTDHGGP